MTTLTAGQDYQHASSVINTTRIRNLHTMENALKKIKGDVRLHLRSTSRPVIMDVLKDLTEVLFKSTFREP